jgi:hypothetical protein
VSAAPVLSLVWSYDINRLHSRSIIISIFFLRVSVAVSLDDDSTTYVIFPILRDVTVVFDRTLSSIGGAAGAAIALWIISIPPQTVYSVFCIMKSFASAKGL